MAVISSVGGGVKTYTDQATLLAAVAPPGTVAYAQDKGNFWFRRSGTWQVIPNTNVMRRVTGPYSMTVDPVLGDDGEWNDGTVTPLKTLEALFMRLPAAINRGVNWNESTAPVVKVLLKGGTHTIPADGYNPLEVDLSNVYFYGETAAELTFELDHYSSGNLKVWQPASNPAWITDEHIGKVLILDFAGMTFPYFIVANGAHDLTVAFNFLDWPTYVPPGSLVSLGRLTSKWEGPRTVSCRGAQSLGFGGFSKIAFDTSENASGLLLDHLGGSLVFDTCLLHGNGNAFASATGPGTAQRYTNCLFWNQSPGVYTMYGTIEIESVAALNCYRIIETNYTGTLAISGSFVVRNVAEAFRLSSANRLGFSTVIWSYPLALYCDGCYQMFSFYGGGRLLVDGNGMTVIDDKRPTVTFLISGGTTLRLQRFLVEGLDPYKTIWIGSGIPDGGPYATITIDELRNLYNNHYNWGDGAEAFYSQHP